MTGVLPFKTDRDVDEARPMVEAHLEANGILAYPTETVYGLGCLAIVDAVEHLIAFKQRRPDKPFLLLISGRRMAEDLGLQFPEYASALAQAFWPGPLTLVLPGGEGKLPDNLRGAEGGIAVRWTSHTGMARLIDQLGVPVTSTSANRPGAPPAPGVGGVLQDFGDAVESGELLVLDGGVLGNVPSSTVIDCTGVRPRLIRRGAIPMAELHARVGSFAP